MRGERWCGRLGVMTTAEARGRAQKDTGPGRLVVVVPVAAGVAPSPRAVEVLAGAAVVAWEDTPRAAHLLHVAAVAASRRRAVDEASDGADLVGRVADGEVVALVADLATPGVSAVVARLVGAVVDAGLVIEVAPAPLDAMAALVASGLATDHIAVEGPLPRQGAARATRLAQLAADRRTTAVPVPDDVRGAVAAVAATCGAGRPVAVAPAGSDVWRGTAAGAAAWAADRSGDDPVVLVVGPATAAEPPDRDDDAVRAALRDARDRGLSPGRAAAEVAAALGRPRREVYALGAAEDET